MPTFPSFGINGMVQGVIENQALLLQDIRDGLKVYNTGFDPFIGQFCETTIRQTLRVSQAPKQFGLASEGSNPLNQRQLFREINVPFLDYDLSTEWSIQGLQDMLVSDLAAEIESIYLGDMELLNSLFYQTLFTPRTAGAIGTPYRASFYNGETDVPSYKNNTFDGTAHYHYLGLNTTTLSIDHIRAMARDIREHGYGLNPNSLVLLAHSNQSDAIAGLLNTNAANTILQAITSMRERGIDAGVWNTGITVEGILIVFNDNVPAGYLGMFDMTARPLARREHINESARGLQMFQQSYNENYPLSGMKFLRRIGFGVQFLGAGTCRQLVASTSYTAPTFRLGGLI